MFKTERFNESFVQLIDFGGYEYVKDSNNTLQNPTTVTILRSDIMRHYNISITGLNNWQIWHKEQLGKTPYLFYIRKGVTPEEIWEQKMAERTSNQIQFNIEPEKYGFKKMDITISCPTTGIYRLVGIRKMLWFELVADQTIN